MPHWPLTGACSDLPLGRCGSGPVGETSMIGISAYAAYISRHRLDRAHVGKDVGEVRSGRCQVGGPGAIACVVVLGHP